MHLLRLIATGIFDPLPDLHIIIGHMGEMIPFMLDRIEAFLSPPARLNGLQRSVIDAMRSNVWVTTSGMFTPRPLHYLIEALGVDRVLFSIDYPFSTTKQGREFLDGIALRAADMAELCHRNGAAADPVALVSDEKKEFDV